VHASAAFQTSHCSAHRFLLTLANDRAALSCASPAIAGRHAAAPTLVCHCAPELSRLFRMPSATIFSTCICIARQHYISLNDTMSNKLHRQFISSRTAKASPGGRRRGTESGRRFAPRENECTLFMQEQRQWRCTQNVHRNMTAQQSPPLFLRAADRRH